MKEFKPVPHELYWRGKNVQDNAKPNKMKAIDRMIRYPTLNPVAIKITESRAHLKKHGSYLGVQPKGTCGDHDHPKSSEISLYADHLIRWAASQITFLNILGPC